MAKGGKVLLGAVVIVPLSVVGLGLLTKPRTEVEVSGQLTMWQFWQNGMRDWGSLSSPVSRLTSGIKAFFAVGGVNSSDSPVKMNIGLILTGAAIEDLRLPAYENQNAKVIPGDQGLVGFGPVLLDPGTYTLYATLKLNRQEVDTGSMQFLVS